MSDPPRTSIYWCTLPPVSTKSQWGYPNEPYIFNQHVGTQRLGGNYLSAPIQCAHLQKGNSSLQGASNPHSAHFEITYRVRSSLKLKQTPCQHVTSRIRVIFLSCFFLSFCVSGFMAEFSVSSFFAYPLYGDVTAFVVTMLVGHNQIWYSTDY